MLFTSRSSFYFFLRVIYSLLLSITLKLLTFRISYFISNLTYSIIFYFKLNSYSIFKQPLILIINNVVILLKFFSLLISAIVLYLSIIIVIIIVIESSIIYNRYNSFNFFKLLPANFLFLEYQSNTSLLNLYS